MGRSSVRFPRDRLPEALQMSEQISLANSESCKPSAQCYSRKKWSGEMGTFLFWKREDPQAPSQHTHQHNCASYIISLSFVPSGTQLSWQFAQPQWRWQRAGLELVYRQKTCETKLPGGCVGEARKDRDRKPGADRAIIMELCFCFCEGCVNITLMNAHSWT